MQAMTTYAVASIDAVLAVARRFPIFPCGADKRPLVSRGFHSASQDEAIIRQWWKEHPSALVAVPTGQVTGFIVIDYDPDKASSATHQWLAEQSNLLLSTRVHNTVRGGKHYIFKTAARYQTGVDLILGGSPRRGIDLRANGGYVIWWPLHISQPPLDTLVAALPAGLIDERKFEANRDMVALPEHSPADWSTDIQRVADAIAFISPDGYERWIKVGMAVHSASGGSDSGFALWHDWSAQGSSYDGIEECRYHWASFGRYAGRSIGLGTLFAAAKGEGWAERKLPPMPVAHEEPTAEEAAPTAVSTRKPIDWEALTDEEPPAREWAIPNWWGIGFLTLLAGPGGVGKTLLAQQMASALAVGAPFLERPIKPLRVLMWAGEDDADELWRRQIQIAKQMRLPLNAFTNFIVESFAARDCTLVDMSFGALHPTSMMDELAAQVADYDADCIILDNVARMYGGDENNRHQVTKFVNMIARACNTRKPTAQMLLAHPAKAGGSEYAGSTAWEAAVRSRWYFGRTTPDAEENAATDINARVLSRRKSNYSGLDEIHMEFCTESGILKPIAYQEKTNVGLHPLRAERIILDALNKLVVQQVCVSDAPRAQNFAIKAMMERGLIERKNEKQLAGMLYKLMESGKIIRQAIGTYANRTPRMGLAVAASAQNTAQP